MSAIDTEVFVLLGMTARLGCLVKGFPTSQVSWYKDGKGKIVKVTCDFVG